MISFPVAGQGRETITVSGTEINGLLDAKRPGPYNEIFHLLTDDYTHPVFLNIAPIRRATRVFIQNNADCFYVGSDNPSYFSRLGMDSNNIMISEGIYQISIKVYGPRGSQPIESREALQNSVIAMDAGVGNVTYVADLMGRNPITILTAQTLEQGFQMLDIGRISSLIAIDTDVKILQNQEPSYDGYPVSDTFSIRTSDDVLVCRRINRTIPFMTHINKRIRELKASGAIQRILDKSILGNGGPTEAGQ